MIDPEALPYEGERFLELMANSRQRLGLATDLLSSDDEPVDAERMMEVTREPTTICRWPDDLYRVESSGAVIMRPRTGDFWACWGQPAENDYEHFSLVPAARRGA